MRSRFCIWLLIVVSISLAPASAVAEKEFGAWFRPIWNVRGASTREHPAPFPVELAWRLVRMFSFVGDTVVDPFVGTGTTMIAAARAERCSIGYEIDREYFETARRRLLEESQSLLGRVEVECESESE